jgi:hypothetical protein
MADGSFAYVPAEGFTAFGAELRTGEWGNIDTTNYIGGDGRLIKAISSAPVTVVMKVQLQGAIGTLLEALKSAGSAKSCDEVWDTAEKRLGVMISAALVSKNAAKQAAAERLFQWLLLGEGAGQTKLKYHQEVDFARKQLELAAKGQCAADVALLELGDLMQDIASATHALAAAIGHGTTGQVPSRRKSATTSNCRMAFGAVTGQLDWIATAGLADIDKEVALGLLRPLRELAARYPAPANPKLAKSPAPQVLNP